MKLQLTVGPRGFLANNYKSFTDYTTDFSLVAWGARLPNRAGIREWD